MILKRNIKKIFFLRLNDDFDAKKLQSKLPKTSLAIPEVSFDVTLPCKQIKNVVFWIK